MAGDTEAIQASIGSIQQVAAVFGFKVRLGNRIGCPAHKGKDPNCALLFKNGKFSWKCHVCHEGGDVFALWAAAQSLDMVADFPRIIREVAEAFGVQLEPRTPRDPSRPAPKRRELAPEITYALALDHLGEAFVNGKNEKPLPEMTYEVRMRAHVLLCRADMLDRLDSEEGRERSLIARLEAANAWPPDDPDAREAPLVAWLHRMNAWDAGGRLDDAPPAPEGVANGTF